MTDQTARAEATERVGIEMVEELERCAAPKLTYADGYCAGCLPSGQVVDEEPEWTCVEADGTHVESYCENCTTTALEIDKAYAQHLADRG